MNITTQHLAKWLRPVIRHHAPAGLSALLATLILMDAGLFLTGALHPLQVVPASDASRMPRPLRLFGLQQVIQAHLFGLSTQDDAPGPQAPRPSWVLSGVIATDNPTDGFALMGQTGQSVRLWRAGAQLPGNGQLTQIFQDRVLIEVQGRVESLVLPHVAGIGERPEPSAQSGSELRGSPAAQIDEQAQRAMQTDEMGALPQTPAQQWLDHVSAQPTSGDGPQGLVLHPLATQRRRFGLQDGDVLTAVNGQTITDADSASSVLNQITHGSLSLTINRDGQTQVISMPMSR